MRRTRFNDSPSPIARVTDLAGDWWTPLVLGELCLGQTRFDQIRARLGCSRSVLTQRLNRLIDEGLVTKHPYQAHPIRHDYTLTEKGEAFWAVLAAMWRWGSDWMFDEPPEDLIDRTAQREVRPIVVDELTGRPLDPKRSYAVRPRLTNFTRQGAQR